MKKTRILMIMFFAILIVAGACKDKDSDNDLDCSTVTFSADIAPIIASKCATTGCHNSGSVVGDYTTYDGLKDKAQNGVMEQEVITDKTMPQSGSLSQDELDKFQCWFDDGAPNN